MRVVDVAVEDLSNNTNDPTPMSKSFLNEGTILGFAIGDDYRPNVKQYTATLENGSAVPDWVKVDPKTGQTLVQFPENIFSIDIKLIAIDKDNTTVVNGAGETEMIQGRVNQIKSQIETTTSDYDKEKLQERLAKLSGGVAVLYVGAPSEVEMKEKKDRVDDALHATRAAVEEGIVAGGGVALLNTQKSLTTLKTENPDEATGVQIINKAIESPLRIIVENSGGEGSVVVSKILDGKDNFGYNAKDGTFVDMLKEGIIDPKKVTRVALENACLLYTSPSPRDVEESRMPAYG
mgnify:CR=1 FL=1